MWTLTSKKDGQTFYLLPEKEKYTVGRSYADLILKDDSSISRNHAWIYPDENHVSVVDVGSKYGTFNNHNIENKVPMIKNAKIDLKIGERIQFGQLGNEWVISKLNICTMTSALTNDQRNALEKDLDALRGRIIDAWSESCTHLTMSAISVTVKVLHSLIANIPIVSMDFWKAYHKELQMGNPPPKPQNYLPQLGESFLDKDMVSFAPNESRKSIFSGKTFIFMSKKHFDTYEPIITKAGGICKDLSKGVRKTELIKKTSIVIQNCSTSLSQSSQTVDNIADYVKQSGRRLIPDREIGLAIIYCSTEKYCNPEFDIVGALIPETPLTISNKDVIAPRTQQDEIIAPKSQQDKIIARRTQIGDDVDILSVEIPESVPIRPENKQASVGLDLFGDDNVDELLKNIPDSKMEIETLKRKRERSVELPNKKYISEMNSHAVNTAKDQPSHSKHEESVVIQETASFSKSVENIEKRVGYMDLSGFLSKNTIAKRPRASEPENSILEEERSKKQKLCFSSDEEDDEIMVTWNYAQKLDFGKKNSRSTAGQDKFIKGKRCKTPERIKPVKKPIPKQSEARIQKNPADFKSKLSSTGWLSVTNIKKEKIEDNDNEDEKDGKSKADWIDSIKEGFEVRVKSMLLTSRCLRDESVDGENSNLNNTNGKNFKAFIKKRNYIPQRTIIRTEPYVVMNA